MRGGSMPTLDEIKSQIQNIDGTSKFFGFKEIKQLPDILWEDELIEKLVQGLYNNGQGILVATNKRLIFVDKGLIYGLRVEDFPYDKITSIQYETGLLFGEIKIFASGNKADIKQINKQQARDFAEYVRARISSTKDHASMPHSTPNDVIAQLEKLAKLKEQGILSEEEFLAQKKKILES